MKKSLILLLITLVFASCTLLDTFAKDDGIYRLNSLSEGHISEKLKLSLFFENDSIKFGLPIRVTLEVKNISLDTIYFVTNAPTYLEEIDKIENFYVDPVVLYLGTDLRTSQELLPNSIIKMKYQTVKYNHFFSPLKEYQLKRVYTNWIYKHKEDEYIAGRLESNHAEITFY